MANSKIKSFAENQKTVSDQSVVCRTCQDTHEMSLGSRLVMCTFCPVPCVECARSLSPYCEKTPCSCECHTGKPQAVKYSRLTDGEQAIGSVSLRCKLNP